MFGTNSVCVKCVELCALFYTIAVFLIVDIHVLSGYSLAGHSGDLRSFPDQSVWYFWWSKWHWGRFISEYVSVPVSGHSTRGPRSFVHHRRFILYPLNSVVK